jgi:glutamine amidotransferase PdxT
VVLEVNEIRTVDDVSHLDGIILPGGESTAMRIIAQAGEMGGSMFVHE